MDDTKNNISQMDGARCLVTGGAGFIGSHLTEHLLAAGAKVRVIDDLRAGSKERIPAGAEHIAYDINDRRCAACFEDIDIVFHLAAIPGVPTSIEDPAGTHTVNVDGTHAVLEAARNAGVKRVVFSSSAAVYGDQDAEYLHEGLERRPISPYAFHKVAGEFMMYTWAATYGIEAVSLRYFNVYGPHMDPEGPYAAVIGKFLAWRAADESLRITGDGTQSRDFIHVADVAQANMLAATSGSVGKGEVFNVGTGIATTVNEIAELFGGPREYITPRQEVHRATADITRARDILGLKPETSLKEGIEELLRTT